MVPKNPHYHINSGESVGRNILEETLASCSMERMRNFSCCDPCQIAEHSRWKQLDVKKGVVAESNAKLNTKPQDLLMKIVHVLKAILQTTSLRE